MKDIIQPHSRHLWHTTNSIPPRPGCIAADPSNTLGAWTPVQDPQTKQKACVSYPEASLAYHTMYGPSTKARSDGDMKQEAVGAGFSKEAVEMAQAWKSQTVKVFATKKQCCASDSFGAWEMGCN